jgi:hypothetical protein
MNDKQIDELIDKALQEDGRLPEGLSERLEQYIDNLAAGEQTKKISLVRRRFIYWCGFATLSDLLRTSWADSRKKKTSA